MTTKYFCDECGIEVQNPSRSLDMTGKILCSKHFEERRKNYQWNNFKIPRKYRKLNPWQDFRWKKKIPWMDLEK